MGSAWRSLSVIIIFHYSCEQIIGRIPIEIQLDGVLSGEDVIGAYTAYTRTVKALRPEQIMKEL
jgi:hypothetical protein